MITIGKLIEILEDFAENEDFDLDEALDIVNENGYSDLILTYETVLEEVTDLISRDEIQQARNILLELCPLGWKFGDGIADFWGYNANDNTYTSIKDTTDLIKFLRKLWKN